MLDVATGQETRLTSDGRENTTLNGIADWVYGEEIWDREPRAYWWSPDGSRIAYYRFDERSVGIYSLLDDSPLYPEIILQKYPKAGTNNPQVRIGVADLARRQDHLDEDRRSRPPTWRGSTGRPAGTRSPSSGMNRDQNRLDLLRCGAADGACVTLVTESWRTWINLGRDFRFLPDGRFLWGSERGGWRRLYLYAADGTLVRPVTPEGWSITALDAVAEDGTWALVTAFPTSELGADRPQGGPGAPRHCRNSGRLGGADPRARLAPGPGLAAHRLLGARLERRQHAAAHRGAARGRRGRPLPLPPRPSSTRRRCRSWEFLTIPGPDGSRLPARLLKPAGFDPSKRYPVLIYHYGGPGSQVVDNNWGGRSVWHKLMALRGFAVFSVDNQSSIFFGKPGEDRDYRRFGPVNLAGQLAGVDYLKSLPWVDASRLGLWGWSGGGSNTLYCILNRPGVWKAAIAGAPVTDWKLYDSIWTERYLDRPQDNADGYRDSSPITYAANLKDRLLIVHGLADDNVHPQNTVQMSGALIKAGLPVEQAFYPGQKHGFRPAELRHFYARATEFFERELLAGGGGATLPRTASR